jgi:hypothetical protein
VVNLLLMTLPQQRMHHPVRRETVVSAVDWKA